MSVYPSADKVYPNWWKGIKEKMQAEGALNKVYDADLDNVVDNTDTVDGLHLPNTVANVLTDHDKALHDALGINADTVDGLHLPNTIASVLTDHNLARHEDLGLRKITLDTSVNRPAAGATTELFIETDTNIIYRGTGTGWQEIGRYVGMNFPNTIANVLTDHDKPTHDALGIDADTLDGYQGSDLLLKLLSGGEESSIKPSIVRVNRDGNSIQYWDDVNLVWENVIGAGSGDVDTVDGEHATAFEKIANKGVANGYCGLDDNALVDLVNIPSIPETKLAFSTWKVVSEVSPTVDVASITFDGLDINADGVYILSGTIKNPTTSDSWLFLYTGDDITTTNYRCAYHATFYDGVSDTTSVYTGAYPAALFAPASASFSFSVIVTRDVDGFYRAMAVENYTLNDRPCILHLQVLDSVSVPNITSLILEDDGGVATIGAESKVWLCKIKT